MTFAELNRNHSFRHERVLVLDSYDALLSAPERNELLTFLAKNHRALYLSITANKIEMYRYVRGGSIDSTPYAIAASTLEISLELDAIIDTWIREHAAAYQPIPEKAQ